MSRKSGKQSTTGKQGKSGRSVKDPKPAVLDGNVAAAPLRSEAGTSQAALRPAGQRCYDLPFSALAPRLVNPSLGLHQLVARAGHNAAYEIDVTLLDAPDHRLVRSGVLLAHRVLDERGEWFLTAPDWQPLLPKDRIELMGDADLPEELADLIRPFRRRAPLGPVAALHCDRREFALRDDGTTLALLRDDRVTVRRGGLTIARYREVMITPVGPGLSEEQVTWVDRALVAAGSTLVPRFPRLVNRLGAPATAPSDFRAEAPVDPDASVRKFLGQLLGIRLRGIVEADLAVRGGDLTAGGRLVEQVRLLRTELAGVEALAEAEWLVDLTDELDWLVGESEVVPDRLPNRLRSERYLTLLDRLVAAARGPKVGEIGGEPAAETVRALLGTVLARLGAAAAAAATAGGAPAPAWSVVAEAFHQVDAALALAGHLIRAEAESVADRLAPARRLLLAVCREPGSEADALAQAASLPSAQAFAAGRGYQQQAEEARRARAAFGKAWTKAERKLASDRSNP